MNQSQTAKVAFFDLPYDVRLLIYERIFEGRCFATLQTTNSDGHEESFLCSSQVLDEQGCLFVPVMPPFKTPDMRLLRTSKTFYAEAASAARQLWFKQFQDSMDWTELRALSTLIRTPPVDSFGRLRKVRLLREATVGFVEEHMGKSGTFVEIVPPMQYLRERMVMTDGSLLVFRTSSPVQAWAAESIDELDYLFYQGVLRNVRIPSALTKSDLVPLVHFGKLGTGGRWLIRDVWHASDPERVVAERKLRATIQWDGESYD